MSNTKLSPSQKADRKVMLACFREFPGFRLESFPSLGVTIACRDEFNGSRMMLVSVSIASLKETKFCRKVGEYYALRRLEMLEGITVPVDTDLEDLAEIITAC